MSTDVFVCHSAGDTAVAEKLGVFLEAQKIPCWIAPRNVALGGDLDEAIMSGIQNCSVMVLIFSASANLSETVRRQVEAAVIGEKVLIPFRIENVAPTGVMETYFRHRYFHDAWAGSLEDHLDALARMLKPLVHQRKAIATDDASISRTLPSRASIVRHSNVQTQAIDRSSSGPLQISLNLNHLLRAGRISTCECQVENRGVHAVESVEIWLESRGLKRANHQVVHDLPPGATHRLVLELEPSGSGNFSLDVTVKWHEGGSQISMTGTRPLIVNEAAPTSDLVRRTQSIPTGTSRLAVPASTPSEELPENFEPLDLELNYQVTLDALELAHRRAPLEIPEPFLDRAQAGALLKLEPMEATSDLPFQDVRVVARPIFGLGRSQEESDFLIWFWPRNEVHDTKTRRISKKHCTLTAEKGRLQVYNTAAASLTTFDGLDLTSTEGVPLERHGVLNLSGIYVLEIMRFAAAFPQGPTISNLSQYRVGTETPPAPAASGSVRFTSLTPNTLPQNATWLLTDGTLGTSRINPVVLDIEGLAEIQARLYHFLGGFWIENLAHNGAVQVDGLTLSPGSIVPLISGSSLQLAQKIFYATVSP